MNTEQKHTPETDAQVARNLPHAQYHVKIEFARKLERQRDELAEALRKVTRRLEHVLQQQGISAPTADIREARAALAKVQQ